MAGFYSVIQYTPDPIIDERINFGVATFGDGKKIRLQFLKNWNRVRQFGANVSALKAFAHQAQQKLTEDMLKDQSPSMYSIQFTKPAASLLSPDELLDDAVKRFLVDPAPTTRTFRTRRDAVALARRTVNSALVETVGRVRARDLIKPHFAIKGDLDEHKFDLTVANGKPFFAVQGFSFEGEDHQDDSQMDTLVRTVRAATYSVEDVRRKTAEFPIGIVVLPPKGSFPFYNVATKMFEEAGAEVITESDVDKWAAYRVQDMPIAK